MPEKAIRLIKIYNSLRNGPKTIEGIQEWAKKSGINLSGRSLHRDLKTMEGKPIFDGEYLQSVPGDKNQLKWKIVYDNSSEELLKLSTINTFYLLKNFAPLSIIKARQAEINHIEQLFYEQNSKSRFELKAAAGLPSIDSSHFYEVPYTQTYHDHLSRCLWAVENRQKIIITAINFDHTGLSESVKLPQTLLPMQILNHRGCIHLSGLLEEPEILLILAIEQIAGFETTDVKFTHSTVRPAFEQQMQKRFGVTENIDDEVYDIRLEFSAMTGSFVEKHQWHPTQKFTQQHNGNWLMNLTCGINRELVGWIFQWMSNVKVLEPPVLQQLVQDRLQAMSSLYQTDAPLQSNNVFRPKKAV